MTSSRKLGPALISTRDSEEERIACIGGGGIGGLCNDQENIAADGLCFAVVGSGDTTQDKSLVSTSSFVDKDLSLNSALTSVGTNSDATNRNTDISPGLPSAFYRSPTSCDNEIISDQHQQHHKQFFDPAKKPQVGWAQSSTHITLEVYLKHVEFYDIYIEEFGCSLSFIARVRSVSESSSDNNNIDHDDEQVRPSSDRVDTTTPTNELQEYHFHLDLYSEVNEHNYEVFELDHSILLIFEKVPQEHEPINWPSLTQTANELSWLKRISSENYKDLRSLLCANYVDNDEIITGGGIKQVPCDFEHLKQRQQQHNQQRTEELQESCRRQAENESYSNNIPSSISNNNININNSCDSLTAKRTKQLTRKTPKRIKYPKSRRYLSRDIFNPFRRNINRFDHSQSSGGSSSLDTRDNNDANNMKHDHRRDTSGPESSKNMSRHPLDFKRTYLFLYNLALFVVFLKVYIILMIKTLSGTMDDESVRGTAFIIKLLTYTQLMESVHPMLGLVPGGPTMPFLQAMGRLVVNHFLAEPTIRIDSSPNAHYLFIVWSSIEIFRYSYYALRVFKVEVYPLTWCRYSLFLPLYPMGGYFESQVIFSTIKYYEKTGAYSVGLPNSANFSFSFPSFLRFYTFVLLGPMIMYLMRYMLSQRRKQLKSKVD